MTDHVLTLSFRSNEFRCHNGVPVPTELLPNLRTLCETVLQPIRERWGAVIITSGYRTPEWNERVGGAKTSTHMTCEGADVRPVKLGDLNEFTRVIESMRADGLLPGLGGIGTYLNWVHLDTRKAADGHLRRWMGNGMGAER